MTCDRFEERLIAGDKPADDAALAAHVGSCLRCFRTAADMRDVPRLAALLREGEADVQGAFDPGARFWDKFPADVASAWVSSRPAAPVRRRTALWERAAAWMRQPVPAALTGAACAVGLVFLVMRTAPPEERAGAGSTGVGAMDLSAEVETTLGGTPDERVAELDLEGLASLRDDLDRALGPASVDDDQIGEAGSSDPTTVAEDLEMLDEVGLLALQERLRQRI
jgi:hypothetical protein